MPAMIAVDQTRADATALKKPAAPYFPPKVGTATSRPMLARHRAGRSSDIRSSSAFSMSMPDAGNSGATIRYPRWDRPTA